MRRTRRERRRTAHPSLGLVLLSHLVIASALLGQNGPDSDPDAAQGYVKSVFHHSMTESINLYNGQLTIPIAVGPAYAIGPKLKFQAMLTYASKAWEFGHPTYEMLHPWNDDPPT